jgi:ribonuclease D
MTPELPPPTLVVDGRGLGALLERLDREDEIACDTEADSFFNYREKVCLIQVSAGGQDYLVDPLAGLDVTPLGKVLADARKTKVFHDGEYDILILKRSFGFRFAGLFDTRVAAAALGSSNPGLASVLEEYFGIEVDKSMQRSNWSARPLSDKQVRYARLDTRFLVDLMHRQRPRLEALDRMRVVEGECRRLELISPPENAFDPADFVRIKGAAKLDKQSQRALAELFVARDRLAREHDVPPFKVLNNDVLLRIARERPRNGRELADLISPRQARRVEREVLEALARARELGPLERLPAGRRDGEPLGELEFDVHEALKEWRKRRAVAEGYDASLVLNRHVLLRLARTRPGTAEELAAVDGLLDWQAERFGDELLAAIGKAVATFEREGPSRIRRRRSRRGP